MIRIFFLFFILSTHYLTLGQTADTLQRVINEFQTPPTYLMFKIDENGKIDTVLMFEFPDDSIEIVKGPNKYKKEIIGICKTYSKILDSHQNDRLERMPKDSLYTEKEKKNRPEKYKGYDGGYEGYFENEEEVKILNVINRFLKIDRISSRYVLSSKDGPTVYDFYYYRTVKDANGKKKIVQGKVTWVDK